MTEFTRKPLALLDRIYRFVGGSRGVNRLALERDISLVHDVSRQADRSGFPPFYGWLEWRSASSTAAVLETWIDRPTDILPLLHGIDNEEEYELFIMGVSCHTVAADVADITSESLCWYNLSTNRLTSTKIGAGAANRMDMVHSFVQADLKRMALTTSADYYGDCYIPRMPLRVQPYANIGWQSVHTAAAITWFAVDMWAGPLGCTPPGLP